MPSYSSVERGYKNLVKKVELSNNKKSTISRAVNRILPNKDKYINVQDKTGVPWDLIAAIHYRESDNDFKAVLHNGERIVGTNRKTRLVPAGRGPFNTWEEAAIDALQYDGMSSVKTWDLAKKAYYSEKFNGFGYMNRGVNSPYVWAGTNLQQPGMYVADGVWDPNKTDPRVGTMAIILTLVGKEDTTYPKDTSPVVVPEPVKPKDSWLVWLLKLLFTKGK